jgi:hypothetical protein
MPSQGEWYVEACQLHRCSGAVVRRMIRVENLKLEGFDYGLMFNR